MTVEEIAAYQAAWNRDVIYFLFCCGIVLFLLWWNLYVTYELKHEKPLKDIPTQIIKDGEEYKPLGQYYSTEEYKKRNAAHKAKKRPKKPPKDGVYEWSVKYKKGKFKTTQIKDD